MVATSFVASDMLVSADFNLVGAAPGLWDVQVQTPSGAGSCVRCLRVNGGVPTLTAASPASRGQGATRQTVTLSGTNLARGATVAVSGFGVTTSNVTWVNLSTVRVQVDITENAGTGARDLTITNTDSQTATCSACFTINPGAKVSSITPNTFAQGEEHQAVYVMGSGFAPGALPDFGTGIVIHSSVVNSDTQLMAEITVPHAAATGLRSVAVRNTDGGTGSCNCMVVTEGPTIKSTSGSVYGQNAGALTIKVNGTGFLPGATATIAGVVTGDTEWVSSSQLKVPATIADNTALGHHTVTVVNVDGGTHTCAACLRIDPPPVVTSINPTKITQGALIDVTVTGSNFVRTPTGAIPTVSVGGGGVAASNVRYVNATQLIATFEAADDASTAKMRNVRVRNPDYGIDDCVECLKVLATAHITSLNPSHATQGATSTPVTLTGSNFAPTARADFGDGITVTSQQVLDSSHLRAVIAISPQAYVGQHDVSVDNQDGAGAGYCPLCFTVDAAPVLTSVSPASRGQGAAHETVTLSGARFVTGAAADFGDGITVNSFDVTSTSQALADITLDTAAAVGPRAVTLTNPDGSSAVCNPCFTVNEKPVITKVVGSSYGQGTGEFDATVNGSGFTAQTVADVSGDGVTTLSTTYSSATKLIVRLRVDSSAAIGYVPAVVSNPDGAATVCADCFQVSPAPVVSSVSPGTIKQGTTQTLTIDGQNFVVRGTNGPRVTVAGGGLTVQSTTLVSSTRLLAVVTADPRASMTTARDIEVINGDYGRGRCVACLTITTGPRITSVTPNNADQGATGVTVVIKGSGYMPGASVSFSGSGITVLGTNVVDDGRIEVTIDVASNAASGARDVTVTNTDNSRWTSEGSFTVNLKL